MDNKKELMAEQRGAVIYSYFNNDSCYTIVAHINYRKFVISKVIGKFYKTDTDAIEPNKKNIWNV